MANDTENRSFHKDKPIPTPLSHYKSHTNRAEIESGPPQSDAAAVANTFKETLEENYYICIHQCRSPSSVRE
jgi:hypothetical protein